MLIELKRIVSKKKRDDNGNFIKDPKTDKFVSYNVVSPESFESTDIKRMRPWNKKKGSLEYPEIDGDITVMIIAGDEIRVNESHSKLLDRLKAAKLEHEYGSK